MYSLSQYILLAITHTVSGAVLHYIYTQLLAFELFFSRKGLGIITTHIQMEITLLSDIQYCGQLKINYFDKHFMFIIIFLMNLQRELNLITFN